MRRIKLVLTFAAIVIFFAACDKKEKGEEDKNTNIVETEEVTFTYKVTTVNLSPIFNATISYKNENNETITLENEPLPWEKTIMAKVPFEASLSGEYVVISGANIPELVIVGMNIVIIQNGINISSTQNHLTINKEHLEEWISRSGAFSLTHKFN